MPGKKRTRQIAAVLAHALLMCAAPCQPVLMLHAAAAVQAAPVTENSEGKLAEQVPAARSLIV